MATFEYVTNRIDTGFSLGISTTPTEMVGTNCSTPDYLGSIGSNWHFRVRDVLTAPSNIYPRELSAGPPTYGAWFNPSVSSQRSDNKCNPPANNWPMHVIQTLQTNGLYRWDIFVAPYLGGAYNANLQPQIPVPGTVFTLKLYVGTSIYQTLTTTIPALSPIFGVARSGKTDANFYAAKFGSAFTSGHPGVDIIPHGVFSNGTPGSNWDVGANAEYKKVFAVVSGTVVRYDAVGAPGLKDVAIIVEDTSSPYYNLEFRYLHVQNLHANGPITAGQQICTVRNHQTDPRSDATHLHFEVVDRNPNPDQIVDSRQFINPGYIPSP